jgi:hypothetical protein
MTSTTSISESSLEAYGSSLALYSGTGHLTLTSGRVVNCSFLAGQLENGKTILLCSSSDQRLGFLLGLTTPVKMEGVTSHGLTVETLGDISQTNYLPDPSDNTSKWLALRVGHLRVSRPKVRTRKRLNYLLTNVSGIHAPTCLTLNKVRLELRPLDLASKNLRRVEVSRGVLPTAELEATTTAAEEYVSESADEICYLLSLALGSKVQWISLTEATKAHRWIRKHHYSRVTKRYGALHVLDTRDQEVAAFIQAAEDGRYSRAREQSGLTNAVLDTYLDAKSEGDFLQVRALKLVIAVEMLKAEFMTLSGLPSDIVSPETFDAVVPGLKTAVKEGLPGSARKEQRDALYSNILGLNRTPFATQLQRLCSAVQMPLATGELKRFVYSRNKLVHEGGFYCERATNDEKAKLQPLPDVFSEWFWLLHFVDRLFLRSINYEGPYINWSKPGPRRDVLVPGAQPTPAPDC